MSVKTNAIEVILCFMTWNELEGCKLDLPEIPPIFNRIIAIDNNSLDGTREYLLEKGVEVFSQISKGYNGAYTDAFNVADGKPIVFFHPKGTINVGSLNEMCENLKNGVDFIIASRLGSGAANEEDDLIFKWRKWFVVLVAFAGKLKWGMRSRVFFKDPLHGYRGMSPFYYKNLALTRSSLTADIEMIKFAYNNKFQVKQIPVRETKRIFGETHFPALSTGGKILKFILMH